jgi:hypothetical protein
MTFSAKHYDCEGPLGIPMREAQARLLEDVLKGLPAEDRTLCRLVTAKAPTEVMDGERADVSWITTEEIDRDGEIVVARGMTDAHFKLNPIVTMNHAYDQPPVGRSLWRKRAKDGPLVGIKAKTQYPTRPDGWPDPDWMPDNVLALIQAGLLQGKSVGFLRLKSHVPNSHEIAAKPALAGVTRIIDEWLLIEYACTFLPTNQAALVEAVSKSDVPEASPSIAFTPETEIHRAIERRIVTFDFEQIARRAIADGIERARGRI